MQLVNRNGHGCYTKLNKAFILNQHQNCLNNVLFIRVFLCAFKSAKTECTFTLLRHIEDSVNGTYLFSGMNRLSITHNAWCCLGRFNSDCFSGFSWRLDHYILKAPNAAHPANSNILTAINISLNVIIQFNDHNSLYLTYRYILQVDRCS